MSKNSAVARRHRKLRERQERKAEQPRTRRTLREQLVNRLDRLEAWLSTRSRPVRILITALIAIILTVAFGLFVFETIFPTTYEAPTSSQSSISQSFTFTMLALVAAGLVFYWIGWRVLVGFDFGEAPVRPGRGAAIWVCLGLLTLLVIIALAFIGLLQAVAPS